MIRWELTIANTLSVEQVGWQGGEEFTTNSHEVELDFYPEVGVETVGQYHEGDDPSTGDKELDKVLTSIEDIF